MEGKWKPVGEVVDVRDVDVLVLETVPVLRGSMNVWGREGEK